LKEFAKVINLSNIKWLTLWDTVGHFTFWISP